MVKRCRGFTIVELLIVVVVIGVLAAITLISYSNFGSRATEASIQTDLHNAVNILNMDYTVNDSYPLSIEEANFGNGLSFDSSDLSYYPAPYGFCIAATKNGITYQSTSDNPEPELGDCGNYGLVLYLDAGNTESYPGSGTTWYDLSGLDRDGTIYNGASYSADGGGSFVFDGLNDYIGLVSPSDRWAWTPGGDSGLWAASFEVWVKTSDGSGWIVSKPWNGSGEYNYSAKPDRWEDRIGAQVHTTSFTSIANGQWRHLVYIIDKTQKKMYIDGVQYGATVNHNITNTVPDHGNSNTALALMTLYPYGDSYYWEYPTHAINGSLAYVKIFDRVLTSEEIVSSYNLTKSRYGY